MYGMLIPLGGGDPIPLRKEELIVGRKDHCDVVLRFNNVSSQHCRLVLSAGYWYVVDLNSTNGVKLNGTRITDHRVDPGATLTIAKHLYRLQYDPMENGATGQPPADVLQEGDMLSRSLLEKAGLEKRAPKRDIKADTGSTVPDIPIVVVSHLTASSNQPQEKRNFFDQLKFD